MNKNFADDALRGLLERRVPAWARCALVLLATAVFAVFAYHARYAKIDEFTGFRAEELIRFTAVVLAALYALTAAVALHIGRRLNFGAQALFCVVIGVILLAKVSLFDYVSDDYDIFLSGWIYSYSQMGIKEGLGSYIGSDYTPPYLYLLLLISRVRNYPWQYLVKIVSMAFEALMAYAVTKLAGQKVRGDAGARRPLLPDADAADRRFQRRVLGSVRRDLHVAVPAGAVSRAAKAQRMEHGVFRHGALLQAANGVLPADAAAAVAAQGHQAAPSGADPGGVYGDDDPRVLGRQVAAPRADRLPGAGGRLQRHFHQRPVAV